MKNRKRILVRGLGILLALALSLAALILWIPMADYGFARAVPEAEARLRLDVVSEAESWLGTAEGQQRHLEILDSYNSHQPLAQDYVVQYTDSWCAAFVSAAAIVTDLTDIIPTECGCQRQIALFQQLKQWEEEDTYLPLPGDIIYFSSHGVNLLENDAWSDHVGIVVGTWGPFIRVIEGNNNNAVRCRTLISLDPTIRGYATPDYSKKAAQ